MDLANGPLPWRAPETTSSEQQTSPWGDFLQRVLLAVGQARRASADAPETDAALAQPVAAVVLSDCRADLPAG